MKAQTKRSVAVSIFNMALVSRETVGNKAFRHNVIGDIRTQTSANVQTAAAMYNFAKKKATSSGLTEAFGRGVGAVAAPVVPAGRWQVVNKVTRAVIDAAATRRAAILLRGDGETVVDSEK